MNYQDNKDSIVDEFKSIDEDGDINPDSDYKPRRIIRSNETYMKSRDRDEECKPPKNLSEEDMNVNISDLRRTSISELVAKYKALGFHDAAGMSKKDIIISYLRKISMFSGKITGEGVAELFSEGFGFLRSSENNYSTCNDDIYISQNQIRKFRIKTGDFIQAEIRAPRKSEKYFSVNQILSINDDKVENGVVKSNYKVQFDDLTPVFPDEKLALEVGKGNLSTRVIDLLTPIGKGQRALIVAPPRTGKTVLLKNIAHAINQNHPEIDLIVLLIDERPEEVVDMQRSIRGDVISSTFDEPASKHIQITELVIARAKRMIENKKDVVILLDSITRLARAYNSVVPSSGKILTGGVDSNALQKPKRIFGAARNIEGGGSLTIIGTALIETGSRMDDVIFEEFKGTGNCEIILDRKMSERRVFPAIDITKSGTRREELLIDKSILNKVWMLRKFLAQNSPVEAMEFLRDKLKNTENIGDFFDLMNN